MTDLRGCSFSSVCVCERTAPQATDACICLDCVGLTEQWVGQHWSRRESRLEFIHSVLTCLRPLNGGILSGELSQQLCNPGEILDESPVVGG